MIFDAISQTIHEIFFHCKNIVTPGFIITLHTFGDALLYKPHFHVIIAEGGFDNNNRFIPFSHWPYKAFRKKWQFLFLNSIKIFAKLHTINDSFIRIAQLVRNSFNNYKDGFYVWANERFENAFHVFKYIGRYVARPPLAMRSILDYDGINVTLLCKDTENKTKKNITLSATEFLGRVFYHLPIKNFKTIRRFGFYARNIASLAPIVKSKRSRTKDPKLSYRDKLILLFNNDPLKCSECGRQMILAILFHFSLISKVHPILQDFYPATG